jgi:hypothetical protein
MGKCADAPCEAIRGKDYMQVSGKTIRRMCVLAGLTVMGAMAMAAEIPADAQIMIDRALNSPTLTIRYNGANAALVELRINGESIGTRSVSAAKASGETNFTIDLNALKDGDNEVEIRLFDRTGKLIGTDKTNISTDQSDRGPVFLKTPKVGATIQGPVEISLGFGKEMKNVYVSFFVDNDFKKMTNYPPYSLVWDTTIETNGWHEIEAWVIDESSTTYKTRKTRVFINNPGGRTDRTGVSDISPRTNPIRTNVTGSDAGTKALNVKGSAQASGAQTTHRAPGVSGQTTGNRVKASPAGGMSGIKPTLEASVLATGAKTVLPGVSKLKPEEPKTTANSEIKSEPNSPATAKQVSGNPVIEVTGTSDVAPKLSNAVAKSTTQNANVTTSVNHVNTATNVIKIAKGQRIPNLGSFAVVLNSEFVNFDVMPRVENGVPMTPFRHLLEKAGGTVDWENLTKSVKANAEGRTIFLKIGDGTAKINDLAVTLERAPYLERGRTIVPLSFLRDALSVEIEFDKETGHVLITSIKK